MESGQPVQEEAETLIFNPTKSQTKAGTAERHSQHPDIHRANTDFSSSCGRFLEHDSIPNVGVEKVSHGCVFHTGEKGSVGQSDRVHT